MKQKLMEIKEKYKFLLTVAEFNTPSPSVMSKISSLKTVKLTKMNRLTTSNIG